jgi:hypothetical protein
LRLACIQPPTVKMKPSFDKSDRRFSDSGGSR